MKKTVIPDVTYKSVISAFIKSVRYNYLEHALFFGSIIKDTTSSKAFKKILITTALTDVPILCNPVLEMIDENVTYKTDKDGKICIIDESYTFSKAIVNLCNLDKSHVVDLKPFYNVVKYDKDIPYISKPVDELSLYIIREVEGCFNDVFNYNTDKKNNLIRLKTSIMQFTYALLAKNIDIALAYIVFINSINIDMRKYRIKTKILEYVEKFDGVSKSSKRTGLEFVFLVLMIIESKKSFLTGKKSKSIKLIHLSYRLYARRYADIRLILTNCILSLDEVNKVRDEENNINGGNNKIDVSKARIDVGKINKVDGLSIRKEEEPKHKLIEPSTSHLKIYNADLEDLVECMKKYKLPYRSIEIFNTRISFPYLTDVLYFVKFRKYKIPKVKDIEKPKPVAISQDGVFDFEKSKNENITKQHIASYLSDINPNTNIYFDYSHLKNEKKYKSFYVANFEDVDIPEIYSRSIERFPSNIASAKGNIINVKCSPIQYTYDIGYKLKFKNKEDESMHTLFRDADISIEMNRESNVGRTSFMDRISSLMEIYTSIDGYRYIIKKLDGNRYWVPFYGNISRFNVEKSNIKNKLTICSIDLDMSTKLD